MNLPDDDCRCPGCHFDPVEWGYPRDAVTGYATENVVRVEADEAQAMQAWVESMRWLGEDVR